MPFETDEELLAEGEALNAMADEVLSLNLQDAASRDHIGAAEAQLAFYERSMKLQLALLQRTGQEFGGEGSLALFRESALVHLAIARAIRG